MVSGNLKGEKFVVITLVITTFLLGVVPITEAKRIRDKEVDEIKTFLKISNIPILRNFDEKELKKLLNKAIKPEIPDFTYGLLVLGTQRDIEWMDMILSQKFLDRNKAHFNNVLDKRLNLFSHYKKLGQDIYFFASKGDQIGPLSGLASEIVSITNKTIEIFVAFDVWKTTKTYKGIWRYFDARRWGYSHEESWGDAKAEMGWVAETRGRFKGAGSSKTSQLEVQFAALWDKWGPYATPFGISEEYKKQVRNELNDSLVIAVESQSFVEEPKPSLLDKIVQQLKSIKDAAAALVSRFNPFKAGPVTNLPEILEDIEEIEETGMVEASPRPAETEEIMSKAESQSVKKEVVEVESQTVKELEETEEVEGEILEPEPELGPELEPESESEPELESEPALAPAPAPEPTAEPTLCEITASAISARFKVLINEIAWMGTNNSANDEWIELKNIWGIPVNLSGWQLLDKTQQIKVIFGEDDVIPVNGFYLLERTGDDSAPNVSADFIYTGALNNTNEALYLFNNECQLEDRVLAEPDWPAGDNIEKKTMERLDAVNWYTGIVDGTPKAENSSPPASSYSPIPPPAFSGSSSPPTSEEPSLSSFSKILISEVQIESKDNQKDDFVELYNLNNEDVDLTNWYLQRKTKSATDFSTYIKKDLFFGKTIKSYGYFLIANASSSLSAETIDATTTYPLTKNNTLVLKNPNREIVDKIGWGDALDFETATTTNPPVGKSIGRRWSTTTQSYIDTDNNQNDFEEQEPTPEEKNKSKTEEGEKDKQGGEETPFLSVVINEIAWAGTRANSADEWLELYNNTSSEIDLNNWTLSWSHGTTTHSIAFSTSTGATTTTILAQGFYLLERTDDKTVNNILADWTGSFGSGLNNQNCEVLSLYDQNEKLIDKTVCFENSCWPGGEAGPDYISMERINSNASGTDSENWANNNRITRSGEDVGGNKINGTPKAENSTSRSFTEIFGHLNIDQNFILTKLGSPYIVEESISISSGAKLTVEPGVIIKFKYRSRGYFSFNIDGELEAIGGENQKEKIVFTSYKDDEYGGDINNDASSTEPAAGDWEWLYFKSGSVANLENVIMRYGGKYHKSCCNEYPPYTKGMVKVEEAKITIKNSLIEKSYSRGLWLTNSSALIDNSEFLNNGSDNYFDSAAIYIENQNSSSTIENSKFKDNNKFGILVNEGNNLSIKNNTFENNQTLIKTNTLLANFSGNTAQNNNLNGILVSGFGFSETISQIDWKSASLPYIFESSGIISTGNTLNIQPGVIIKFKGGHTRIYVKGTLKAQGSLAEKIVFTALNDDEYGGDTNNDGFSTSTAGYWDYIYFYASSTDSILDNVIVRYGGFTGSYGSGASNRGAVVIEKTSMTVSNSLFESNFYVGLELDNSTSTVQNSVFRGHSTKYSSWGMGSYSRGLYLKNSNSILNNCHFENNYYGIYIEAGDCLDLSNVIFGTEENTNSVDIYPLSCSL